MLPSRTTLFAASALPLLFACGFEPSAPDLSHSLNTAAIETNADLADSPAGQAQLAGALEMLFGTPQAPSYMPLEEWIEEGIAPNPGADALGDDEYDSLLASNRNHFRKQIAAIEAATTREELDAVSYTRYADDLWEDWLAFLEEVPEDGPDGVYDTIDGEDFTWKDEAIYLFESYYPSLTTSALMYRGQCYHCHGTSGGGDGSTAPYLNPRPRDYRPGKFKFTALGDKARPRHSDLYRVLVEGVYTTAMPSFRRFSDAQLHGLVDYVTLLSKRGETELLLIDRYDPDEGFGGIEKVVEDYAFVHDRWQGTEEKLITYDGEVPPYTPEAVTRGRALFMDAKGPNCFSCHGADGLGNGLSAFETDAETGEQVRVKDDWGNEIRPRNLNDGVFRLGRRPIDLYRRIYAGINGTPMPAHFPGQVSTSDGGSRPTTEEDIWDLVHYVRSLSTAPRVVVHEAEEAHGDGDEGEAH